MFGTQVNVFYWQQQFLKFRKLHPQKFLAAHHSLNVNVALFKNPFYEQIISQHNGS